MLNLKLHQTFKLQLGQTACEKEQTSEKWSAEVEEEARRKEFLSISFLRQFKKQESCALHSKVANQRLAKDIFEFEKSFHSYASFEAHLSAWEEWEGAGEALGEAAGAERLLLRIDQLHQKPARYLFEVRVSRDFPFTAPSLFLLEQNGGEALECVGPLSRKVVADFFGPDWNPVLSLSTAVLKLQLLIACNRLPDPAHQRRLIASLLRPLPSSLPF